MSLHRRLYPFSSFFFLISRRPPRPTLFPYTTLFRSLPTALPTDLSLSLFRILQEALRNATKHSGVKRFEVRLWRSRSEEHTSELQSRGHLVCRLLLEKKNKQAGINGRTQRPKYA